MREGGTKPGQGVRGFAKQLGGPAIHAFLLLVYLLPLLLQPGRSRSTVAASRLAVGAKTAAIIVIVMIN